ncbi:hypothetical protein BD779DRAFT_1474476 [Infundibulicybe gibba]|nr:hypothetical protein BD779DRAFT_1474476 [Infundibulicybe gibba]
MALPPKCGLRAAFDLGMRTYRVGTERIEIILQNDAPGQALKRALGIPKAQDPTPHLTGIGRQHQDAGTAARGGERMPREFLALGNIIFPPGAAAIFQRRPWRGEC